ncbi:MAG: trypsin-like peptidase domain-containing protein [Deltaproteobacteria bacterium]|nr:trypsin-like peptidase domain-containing protein [Deltaproteobacteria bacterium]
MGNPRRRVGAGATSTSRLALVAVVGLSGCAASRARTFGDVIVHEGSTRPRGGAPSQLSRSRQAVAVIETDVGRGMGFVVDPNGYLITNRHVIEDADHIVSVSFPEIEPSRTYEGVSVVYTDPEHDLALLQIETDDELPYLPLATRKVVPVGRYLHETDDVLTFRRGDEGGEWLSLDRGKVDRLAVYNPVAGKGAFVGVSAPIQRGQSGGPVLDDAGRAVGVVTWIWRDKEGGFAIPIAEANRMLAERPHLDRNDEKVARAESRSRNFLTALGRGDVEGARQLTSPSFARKVRGEAVSAIMGAIESDGMPVMQGFIAAVESLVISDHLTREVAFDRLREMVSRTGTEAFRGELGVADVLPPSQVVTFFFEFGQAYFAAREFGQQEPEAALATAMQRLQTIDAARTFALADAMQTLGGTSVEIDEVELVPAAYAPRALVTLKGQRAPSADDETVAAGAAPQQIAVHMRLEWGDWYVASVGRAVVAEADED